LDDRSRYVIGGAMLGAVLGSLVGYLVARQYVAPSAQSDDTRLPAKASLDMNRIFRLGVGVVGIVRQVLELE